MSENVEAIKVEIRELYKITSGLYDSIVREIDIKSIMDDFYDLDSYKRESFKYDYYFELNGLIRGFKIHFISDKTTQLFSLNYGCFEPVVYGLKNPYIAGEMNWLSPAFLHYNPKIMSKHKIEDGAYSIVSKDWSDYSSYQEYTNYYRVAKIKTIDIFSLNILPPFVKTTF